MNKQLFEIAKKYIPGGVNSPVRAFGDMAIAPPFMARGKGAYLYDTEQRSYIDYVCSWGAIITGHANMDVIQQLTDCLQRGSSFGTPTELETEMASMLCALVPSIEKIRMVNSGTEAAMSAIRLARGYTKRNKIIKFIGCYHGHVDALLVKAGSGAMSHGVPDSAGVTKGCAQDTICLDFNRSDQVAELFLQQGEDIAAVIVEPVAGNMNCVPADVEFLRQLRSLCSEYGSVLIFDEVMSGFRVALNGAQSLYNVDPDLTLLGKVIGGGLPVGAFGGKRDIMDQLAPQGPVYQAGTLSGNPLAMSAGIATLKLLDEQFFERLNHASARLTQGMAQTANELDIPFATHQLGGMFGFFFSEDASIRYFDQVTACDGERFRDFFSGMLKEGIYLAPSMYESSFISSAHGHAEIERTLEVTSKVLRTLKK